ncbi:MAG: DUF4252 domain-containing protein [Acidobacteriota bacterium]|nr:DUF4252 domain-containing protein [Acidobacteriota bacterium]
MNFLTLNPKMPAALCAVALLLSLGALPAAAQAPAGSPVESPIGGTVRSLTAEPGYVDLALLPQVRDAEPTIEVNLSGTLLNLLAESMRGEDEDFAILLSGLRSIRVRIFDQSKEGGPAAPTEAVAGQIRSLSNRLSRDGWESVVRVRDESNQIHILLRTANDSIAGLVALFSDPEGSFGFINIVGDFDPQRLGRLARQLNLEPLAALDAGGGDNSQEAEQPNAENPQTKEP